jgi:hypothetical protein
MVSADGRGLVSQAGAVLLWETMRVTGLGRGPSTGLDWWQVPRATSPPREEPSRNSAMAVNELGFSLSADGKGEEGIDRSFEWTGIPTHLGE